MRKTFLVIILAVTASAQSISGILEKNTELVTDLSPWEITADLTVPAGITLTIQAGCILEFTPAAHLYIEAGGCLKAEGTAEHRIQMNSRNSSEHWRGIRFIDSLEENQLSFIDMMNGDASQYCILVDHSRLHLKHCTWNPTNKTIVELSHPSAVIESCVFPATTEVEVIHGTNLEKEEYLILRGNTFNSTTGYNDIIDFTGCSRPGPIFQVYDNLFLGGGDDGLDLDHTDAFIEGNIFMNFHKGHTGSSTSNAIATGVDQGISSNITVVRNLFFNNDHGILLKENCYLRAENNTFVNNRYANVNFSEWPDRNVDPGKGALFDSNIFWKYEKAFENITSQPGKQDPSIIVNRCIITQEMHHLGVDNLDIDPQFVDPEGDFHLQPGSPAIGRGENGLDIGAYVPAGVSLSGEPDETTSSDSALISIAGPGMTDYQYVLNDPNGVWSQVFSVDMQPQIELLNLKRNESYELYARGKNDAGLWQLNPPFAKTKTWTVVAGSKIDFSHEQNMPFGSDLLIFPNPFNGQSKLTFSTVRPVFVTAELIDILGRHVQTLFAQKFDTGVHQFSVNGASIPAGIYHVLLVGDHVSITKRIVLIR
ncbi:MAG: T9SS C-terminal target domain-containing protein [Calditrichaeota bacterium]|nr:MAG: T9SS C-terminal target domain-containing protein [Calditrichota bacterium]